jgi:hypothetical protein
LSSPRREVYSISVHHAAGVKIVVRGTLTVGREVVVGGRDEDIDIINVREAIEATDLPWSIKRE